MLGLCLLLAPTVAAAQEILGVAPAYTPRTLSTPPNAAAVTTRIWAPGLGDGYVPQGIALVGGSLFVGGYRSTDPKTDRGPCRLFRVDAKTGRTTASLDLPPSCGHAGGLAAASDTRLWVVDTHVMHEVELAPSHGATLGRVLREVAIAGPLKGSLSTVHDGAIWLGSYERDAPGRLDAIPLARLAGKPRVTAADVSRTLAIPSKAQGAAFDDRGRLWIARSGSKLGELVVLDPSTGTPHATYAAPDGIEGLAFAPGGRLWTLSEAGSQRWLGWKTFFPLVFALDPARLR